MGLCSLGNWLPSGLDSPDRPLPILQLTQSGAASGGGRASHQAAPMPGPGEQGQEQGRAWTVAYHRRLGLISFACELSYPPIAS